MQRFRDRRDAGRRLAAAPALARRAGRGNTVVLALPRGGVPVAYEVATALRAPLDVFLVRKLGTPGHEELAMGAVASGGVVVTNQEIVDSLAIPRSAIDAAVAAETREMERREREYRGARPAPAVAGRTVVLVDDGLATGATMLAAVQALRQLAPAEIVVVVPVGARETCETLSRQADEVVCFETPEPFRAVGLWYEDFAQTGDDEVRALLEKAEAELGPVPGRTS
jgi:putative phosphoribosyl transferase